MIEDAYWVTGALAAGRYPGSEDERTAAAQIAHLERAGVTRFVDLTHEGELEPYAHLLPPTIGYLRRSIRDFSVPSAVQLEEILEVIDRKLDQGGVVYVHCWAGCGRTGVVVGSWLVRHGTEPKEALRLIAELRGLGCPQTLEQRLMVLGWPAGPGMPGHEPGEEASH